MSTARIPDGTPCNCPCECLRHGRKDDDGTPGRCDPCRMGLHWLHVREGE